MEKGDGGKGSVPSTAPPPGSQGVHATTPGAAHPPPGRSPPALRPLPRRPRPAPQSGRRLRQRSSCATGQAMMPGRGNDGETQRGRAGSAAAAKRHPAARVAARLASDLSPAGAPDLSSAHVDGRPVGRGGRRRRKAPVRTRVNNSEGGWKPPAVAGRAAGRKSHPPCGRQEIAPSLAESLGTKARAAQCAVNVARQSTLGQSRSSESERVLVVVGLKICSGRTPAFLGVLFSTRKKTLRQPPVIQKMCFMYSTVNTLM